MPGTCETPFSVQCVAQAIEYCNCGDDDDAGDDDTRHAVGESAERVMVMDTVAPP